MSGQDELAELGAALREAMIEEDFPDMEPAEALRAWRRRYGALSRRDAVVAYGARFVERCIGQPIAMRGPQTVRRPQGVPLMRGPESGNVIQLWPDLCRIKVADAPPDVSA